MLIFNQGEHGSSTVGGGAAKSDAVVPLEWQFSENLVSRIRHASMLSVAIRSNSSCNRAFHWSMRTMRSLVRFTGSDISFLGCAKVFSLLGETPAHALQIQLDP